MAKPVVIEYQATIEKTIKIIPAIIARLGYTLGTVDRENGIVNFETEMSMSSFAGQKMSAHILDIDEDTVQVTIGGTMKSHGAQLQVYDWGEARKIATKVFEQLDQSLGKGRLVSGDLKPGFCFVATAVYGDYDHPAVLALRKFRETKLSRWRCGSILIRCYYACGPCLAAVAGNVPVLRNCTRLILDRIVRRLGNDRPLTARRPPTVR